MARRRDLIRERDRLLTELETQRREAAHWRHEAAEATVTLGDLRLQDDAGWRQLGQLEGDRLTRADLSEIVPRARLYAASNPLIKRGVRLRGGYTLQKEPTVTVHRTGESERDEAATAVAMQTMRSRRNKGAFFGPAARLEANEAVDTDGTWFLALHADQLDGRVSLRVLPWEQITDVLSDPFDPRRPLYWRRDYRVNGQQVTELLPDHRHPGIVDGSLPGVVDDMVVNPDMALRPVRTLGRLAGHFGVPEVWAGLEWARAYTEHLQDVATLYKSLAMFAWTFKTKTGTGQATAARLDTSITSLGATETNMAPVAGSGLTVEEGYDVSPINKTGATLSGEAGYPMRKMVASALGLADHELSGDADQGNHATAKSMHRPTELEMQSRRDQWSECISDVILYALRASVMSLGGELPSEDWDDDDPPYEVTVSFPDLAEQDPIEWLDMLVQLLAVQGVDRRTVLSLVYQRLNVANVDDLLDDVDDDDVPVDDETMAAAVAGLGDALVEAGVLTSDAVASVGI